MINILHFIIRKLIVLYKCVEFQILDLFNGSIERSITNKLEKIGVVFESVGSKRDDNYEHILEKCKYDKICRLQLINKRLLTDMTNRGNIALGEGYMNGDFKFTNDESDITEFVTRCLSNNYFRHYFNCWNSLLYDVEFEWINLQTSSKAWEVGKKHYDLGNAFFRSFLGSNMVYSSAYWANADTLDKAQIDKLELIAKKLDLKPGMVVLDLGCGWGTLCKYLAENYGVSCVGITVSKEGYEYAKRMCHGLPIEFLLEDYRQLNQKFDRIVSIEMSEHVGFRNYREFLEVVYRCLKPDGIFLLHVTTITDSTIKRIDTFIHQHCYPNISYPHTQDITKGIDGLLVIEDWHNMSIDFGKTCFAWRENFIKNWSTISNQYDEQFYRMWTYFLSVGEAGFNSKKYELAQIVFTRPEFKSRYIVAR
ncbi:cyclopropane-fatty-acyl-phospholipid synthase-like [Bradysia coprophila]|uniref:cyclopropane-fatty-acyl-phospholipid synthase-like n=1 Tax=Bradysia coprophila TaxID=38358 RepID=UPI00187D8F89|nr:cyclopropane-fatty-acyl-phospholipid synthase-like [Bradysia coprophila]